MKKQVLLFFIVLFVTSVALADSKCFLAKENNTILLQEGDCKTRFTPQSTFKIALSLMGYDAGILKNQLQPQWPFKRGYDSVVNVCKGAHNPRTWLRDSCVWYSQVLTQKLGMEKFKKYVREFNYGNQDVSGDKDKNNGLTHAWVSSSLAISPEEQIVFLQKLTNNRLPVSRESLTMTKKNLFREELPGGWKLYGKTGSANLHGWFVGWIEKNGRIITFASHITDDKKQELYPSFRAREQAKNNLWKVVEALIIP